MSETRKYPSMQSAQYQITVQGIINASWAEWLGGIKITTATDAPGVPVTIIEGNFADQAKLRGVLVKLWDLNATLIAVQRISTQTEKSTNQSEV